jgi:H+/Cl- antiporter ClcA
MLNGLLCATVYYKWFIVCMISATVYYKCIVTDQTVNFLQDTPASDLGQTVTILAVIFCSFSSLPAIIVHWY